MLIEITYNVTDVFVSTTQTPIYVSVSFEQPSTGGGTWGTITGTLSNQTDLQSALDLKVPYTGATTNVNLGEYEIKAGQVTLDTSPTGTAAVGTTRWNDTTGLTETTLKGGTVVLKNGVDLVARVVNKVSPNTTLTKAAYQAVRVSGAQGQRLAVAFAQANNDNNSADTIGLVTETIATNQEGFIITVGQLEGINTTGSLQGETWADGDVLYLSPTTAGALTNVKPNATVGHIVVIGYVEYAHANNGKIYVKVMNGWELGELHDVYVPTPSNNDVLTYETSSGLWKNKSVGTALGYTPANAATTLTINGVTYDLSTSRTWTISTGISGSGASGQVAYWTGASTQSGDTGLTWDTTNKRLVINTSGQSTNIGNFYGLNSVGQNIWIGGGGTQSVGVVGETYRGSYNTSIGNQALNSNTTGYNNLALGYQALYTNTTGYNDTAFGSYSLYANTIGYQNVAFGMLSLRLNTEGFNNTAIGHEAGRGFGGVNGNTTGSNNIFIGFQSVGESSTASNRTFIGNTSTTSTWLGGNLLLGSRTDSGQRLQVQGTTLLNGNVTFSSATGMFWDATNSRLGIGTNAPANTLHLSAYNTTNSQLRIGSLELQSFSLNNTWLGSNVYYNSGFVVRDTGNTGLFYFLNDEGQFRMTTSLTAGTVITSSQSVQLKINSLGNFALGQAISNNSNGFTGAKLVFYGGTGNLLIGSTTDSGERLQVTGNVKVTGNTLIATGTAGTLIGSGGTTRYTSNSGVNTSAIYISAATTTADVWVNYVGGSAVGDIYTYFRSSGYIGTRGGLKLGASTGSDVLSQLTSSWLSIAAGTTTRSQISLASSTAPTSPNDGDIWFDGTDIKMRIGGVTKTFTLI